MLNDDEGMREMVRSAHVHHLVTMKAYVMEMDAKVHRISEEHEHRLKKYRSYKEKYTELLSENKKISNQHYEIVQAYKGKINSYEILVEKLTTELEKFL